MSITHAQNQDFTLLRGSWGDEWNVPDEGYIHSQVVFSVTKHHMIIFSANAKDLAGLQLQSQFDYWSNLGF